MRISDWISDVCSSDLRIEDDQDFAIDTARAADLRHAGDRQQFLRHRVIDEPAELLDRHIEIGSASCRDIVCQYVYISVVAVSSKKNTTYQYLLLYTFQLNHAITFTITT